MQTSHGYQRACVRACKSCASSTLSYATIQTLKQRCRHAGVFYPIATYGVVTLSPPRLRMKTTILNPRHDAASESLPVISSKVFTQQRDKSVPLSGVITLSRRQRYKHVSVATATRSCRQTNLQASRQLDVCACRDSDSDSSLSSVTPACLYSRDEHLATLSSSLRLNTTI